MSVPLIYNYHNLLYKKDYKIKRMKLFVCAEEKMEHLLDCQDRVKHLRSRLKKLCSRVRGEEEQKTLARYSQDRSDGIGSRDARNLVFGRLADLPRWFASIYKCDGQFERAQDELENAEHPSLWVKKTEAILGELGKN